MATNNRAPEKPQQKKKEYVKLSTALHDDSIKILELENNKVLITFNFDSNCQAVISCFFYVLQREDPVHCITAQIAVTPSRGGECHFQHQAGKNQQFQTELTASFSDPYYFTKDIVHDMYPLIIRMEKVNTDKTAEREVSYTYFYLEKDKDGVVFTKKMRQKIEVGNSSWELMPIYGSDEKTHISAKIEDTTKDCIICFDERVDVLVIPCRHLCLGLECAKLIRNQQKKNKECPVCRTKIEKFIRINGL
jgi:hypothetical protein